jgi:hypothetical protein
MFKVTFLVDPQRKGAPPQGLVLKILEERLRYSVI